MKRNFNSGAGSRRTERDGRGVNKCPYQDICFSRKKGAGFIAEADDPVCETEKHRRCVHFMSLDTNLGWLRKAREAFRGGRG